jgi:hypothetical protein
MVKSLEIMANMVAKQADTDQSKYPSLRQLDMTQNMFHNPNQFINQQGSQPFYHNQFNNHQQFPAHQQQQLTNQYGYNQNPSNQQHMQQAHLQMRGTQQHTYNHNHNNNHQQYPSPSQHNFSHNDYNSQQPFTNNTHAQQNYHPDNFTNQHMQRTQALHYDPRQHPAEQHPYGEQDQPYVHQTRSPQNYATGPISGTTSDQQLPYAQHPAQQRQTTQYAEPGQVQGGHQSTAATENSNIHMNNARNQQVD